MKLDWYSQLIAHGLKSFYEHGTCTSGHLLYDFLGAFELPMEIKKRCLRMCKKNHNTYKKHLVNAYLDKLQKEGTTVTIEPHISPITFTI